MCARKMEFNSWQGRKMRLKRVPSIFWSHKKICPDLELSVLRSNSIFLSFCVFHLVSYTNSMRWTWIIHAWRIFKTHIDQRKKKNVIKRKGKRKEGRKGRRKRRKAGRKEGNPMLPMNNVKLTGGIPWARFQLLQLIPILLFHCNDLLGPTPYFPSPCLPSLEYSKSQKYYFLKEFGR